MDNIDDLMRKKFDSDNPEERFEFQEEFWEQAQVLLEQEEARRRKRGWWLIRWALALGAICLLIWCLQKPVGAAFDGDGSAVLTHTNPQGSNTSQEQTTDNASPSLTPSASGASDERSAALKTGKTNSNAAEVVQQAQPPSSAQQVQKNISKSPKSPESNPKTVTFAGQKARSIEINTEIPESPNLSGVAREPQTTSKVGIPNDSAEGLITPITNVLDNVQPVSPIITLPNAIEPLVIPQNRTKIPLKVNHTLQPLAQKPEPQKKPRRVSVGLTFAGTAYQVPAREAWAGGLIGLSGSFRLDKNWSLGLGVQGRYMPGQNIQNDSFSSNEVVQLRYSFGFEQEVSTLQNRALYGVEVPISVQWNTQRWAFEAGSTLGRWVAFQDDLTNQSSSSLGPTSRKVSRNIKGDPSLYQRNWASAFVGAQYQLGSRLTLTGRLQQRFQPFYQNAVNEGNRSRLRYIDLGMRIRL